MDKIDSLLFFIGYKRWYYFIKILWFTKFLSISSSVKHVFALNIIFTLPDFAKDVKEVYAKKILRSHRWKSRIVSWSRLLVIK